MGAAAPQGGPSCPRSWAGGPGAGPNWAVHPQSRDKEMGGEVHFNAWSCPVSAP